MKKFTLLLVAIFTMIIMTGCVKLDPEIEYGPMVHEEGVIVDTESAGSTYSSVKICWKYEDIILESKEDYEEFGSSSGQSVDITYHDKYEIYRDDVGKETGRIFRGHEVVDIKSKP